MPHYKDPQNNIHFVDERYARLLPAGCVEISDAEADAIREANAPPPTVPTTVTMRQAQRALYDAGLLANVESAIASFPGELGDKARIDWRTAQEVKRDDPIVQALVPSLGLTEQQLDALFTAAAAIQ